MRVKFFAYIRDYTGCSEADMPVAATIGDLARILGEHYGPKMHEIMLTADGELGPNLIIMVNGRHIVHLGGINTPLKDDDIIQIFPKVAGG
jgi:molybdopterin synthase sulfur carrier subunit